MKLITFESRQDHAGGPRLGAIADDGTVVDLLAATATGIRPRSDGLTSMLALIDGGAAALDAARDAFETATTGGVAEALHDPATIRLFAPLPNPRRLREGGCFLPHSRTAGAVRFGRLAER
jgi:hypothetical protein